MRGFTHFSITAKLLLLLLFFVAFVAFAHTFHYNDSTSVRPNSVEPQFPVCVVHEIQNGRAPATVLHITRTRYLVYISLINYVFSFCTLRLFMLAISFCLFCSCCRSSFTSLSVLPFSALKTISVAVLFTDRSDLCTLRFRNER